MSRRIAASGGGIPALEPIAQELYDTKPYTITGTNTMIFFRNPSPLGELYTNMQGSGQLPHPQQYHVFGLACEILPGEEEDAEAGTGFSFALVKKKVREAAWLRFGIGSKDYLTIPLNRVPEGIGTTGLGAAAAGVPTFLALTNGVQDIKHAYEVTVPQQGKIKPIHIPAQQAFFVELRWVSGINITGLVQQMPLIRVYLIGVLWREVQ